MNFSKKRIVVTGGNGFVGRHVVAELLRKGCDNIFVPSRNRHDLRSSIGAAALFDECRPDIIIHLAASVGGIGANMKRPAEFFYDNIKMGIELIDGAQQYGKLEKFVQIGTVCSYPKFTSVLFKEEDLWNGYPEETNAPYGIAKKALLTMAQAYRQQYGLNSIYLIPVNMYGPGDNFNLDTSHVIPAMIRKFAEAKKSGAPSVTLWGTGQATREFLYVQDAAEGIVKATEFYDGSEPVNLGAGQEVSILALASTIGHKIGYDGAILFDLSKPDGQPRRSLDIQRAAMRFEWAAKTDLSTGLDKTIRWYYYDVEKI
jgi:GDP-L-fucose synthase